MRFCLSVCLLPSSCWWTCKVDSNFPSCVTRWCIWIRGGADSGTPWYCLQRRAWQVGVALGRSGPVRSFPRWDTPQNDHDSAAAKGPLLEITRFKPPSLNPSIRTPNTCRPSRKTRPKSCGSKIRISERAQYLWPTLWEPNGARIWVTSFCWSQERSTQLTRGCVTLLIELQWDHCFWWTT